MILFLPFLYHCGGQKIYFVSYLGSFIFVSFAYTSVGDSYVASAVINESVLEGEEARMFLKDVYVTSPQVFLLNTPYILQCFSFTVLYLD